MGNDGGPPPDVAAALAAAAAAGPAPVYTAADASAGVLKRRALDDATLPPSIQVRVDALFPNLPPPVSAQTAVASILASVRDGGDEAVARLTSDIDGVDVSAAGGGLAVPADAVAAALQRVDPALAAALRTSRDRVLAFHRKQPAGSWMTTDLGGVLGQLVRPLDSVGVYVPGGTAPLPSTVIMSVVPALAAGVRRVVVVSPPERATGAIADVTLAAIGVCMEVCGEGGAAAPGVAMEVYRVGGAQAVAALAHGTATIAPVVKIVGPGNVFVALAKRAVYGLVGIDGIYGPTEAVVLADDAADPELVAADLLAQAEHDLMAAGILITPSAGLAARVNAALGRQLPPLDREAVARASLAANGGLVVTSSMDEAVDLANSYAAEHVSLCVADPWALVGRVTNAGGLFLGEASCEVLGDYVAGPSHVMPTGGSARFAGPLSVSDFVKVTSVVGVGAAEVPALAGVAEVMARAEGLGAHAEAARLRRGPQ